MNRVCFIGHRTILTKNVEPLLIDAVNNALQEGCNCFAMGNHGDFDKLALKVCRNLRNQHSNMKIEVVLTSLHKINQKIDDEIYNDYSDVETVIYNIEDIFYKRQIIESNKQMINSCDTLICYVNLKNTYSGAKYAYNYAKKKGLRIINLFK